MQEQSRGLWALAGAILLSSMIGSWAFLHSKDLNNTIQVTGSSKKRIKSDVILWKTSVTVEAPTLAAAYTKITHDVEKVREFLVAQGVPADKVVISAVSTTPMRRGGNRSAEEEGYGAPSGPIIGYSLSQALEIRSSEIDKVTLISRKVTELINQGILLESQAPRYLYTRLAEEKVEILSAAARDAYARAQQIADSTGSTVGRVRSADMGVLQITAADSTDISGYGMNDTSSLEKDITAVVHITFALR